MNFFKPLSLPEFEFMWPRKLKIVLIIQWTFKCSYLYFFNNDLGFHLQMPVFTIASAAGFDESVVVRKLLDQDNQIFGHDPSRG